MSTLQSLKAAAAAADSVFDDLCRAHYGDGRWDYFRAAERGERTPAAIDAAHSKSVEANHAYYFARDGERGFLGKYEVRK